jgi:hypothetical protein
MKTETRSTLCDINGKQFRLWTNPVPSDLRQTPEVVRFTADRTTGNVYVWDYSCAMHTDMSLYLGLHDPYCSEDFLKGAAKRGIDGRYRMVESHFLQAFRRSRLTKEERTILENLLRQDWSWVSLYVEVAGWLDGFQKARGI